MFKRDDVALAHQWTGIYQKYNGEGVRIVGSLRMREAKAGDGTRHKVEAYEVLAPNGERIVCAPRNLLPLYEPVYRFRIDLELVSWAECHWKPKELEDGNAEDGLDPTGQP